jgi:hypothetical protein
LKRVKTNAKRGENKVECVSSKFLVITEGGKNIIFVGQVFGSIYSSLVTIESKKLKYSKSYLI